MPAPIPPFVSPRPALAPEQAIRLCAVIRASLEGVAAAVAAGNAAMSELLYDRIADIEEIERALGCCVRNDYNLPPEVDDGRLTAEELHR